MIRWLYKHSNALEEDDTKYDGPFSWKAEYHSMLIGLFSSMVDDDKYKYAILAAVVLSNLTGVAKGTHVRDAFKETTYLIFGTMLGSLIKNKVFDNADGDSGGEVVDCGCH